MSRRAVEAISKNRSLSPRRLLLIVTMVASLALASCSATNTETILVQPSVAEDSGRTVIEPVPTVAIQDAAAIDWSQVAGKEGDLYVLGNPSAPIRLVDYSDFL